MRIVLCIMMAALCAGCVTTEQVSFRPGADQQAMIRDGNPGIVSTKKDSIVIVRPASRQFQIGGRPVFVVAIFNRSKSPLEFRVANVQAAQIVNGEAAPIKVITYEELVQEEHNRQVFAALATGLAAGANAYSASQAGYYHSNATVYTPHGTYQMNTTGYSPAAAAIAQSNASAENAAMMSATIERGQQNLAVLERSVIKDDTVMPGEWYGGQLHLSPLVSSDGAKTYSISIMVGGDRHDITVVQGAQAHS
jgi:hypothetical protein